MSSSDRIQTRSPVLIVAFRRPDLTAQVLDAVRAAEPARLYAAIDGPREDVPGEEDLVAATREVIERAADWDVELHLRVREQNLGCRRGVADAIDWFFRHEPEGIILEDDCVPHPDFFPYCDELLQRYRDDPRVFAVCGDNSSMIDLSGPWSYGFIRYPNVWGWASWRRAWAHYDDSMALWQAVRRDEDALALVLPEMQERAGMRQLLDTLVDTGRPDTWDYRWSAACVLNGGLCAIPSHSLVENIGFGPDATHTRRREDAPRHAVRGLLPLAHPPLVVWDRPAERQVFLRGSDLLEGWARWRMRGRTALRLLAAPGRWRELGRTVRLRLLIR